MTDRGLAENVHLSLDWKISKNDRLFIKAYQEFDNNKQKVYDPDLFLTLPYYNRYVGLVLSYSHTFSNDAILFAEAGADYTRASSVGSKMGVIPMALLNSTPPSSPPAMASRSA